MEMVMVSLPFFLKILVKNKILGNKYLSKYTFCIIYSFEIKMDAYTFGDRRLITEKKIILYK